MIKEYLPTDWQPVTLTDSDRRALIRQAVKGTIDRRDFPALWPPEYLKMTITLPEAPPDENS